MRKLPLQDLQIQLFKFKIHRYKRDADIAKNISLRAIIFT